MPKLLLVCSFLVSFFTLTSTQDPSQFSAVVSKSEAVFSMPVQSRAKWSWRLPTTRDNQMEYRMDVTVKNEGKEYTFGFYLWKRAGSSPGSGSLNDLISTGQKSLFERAESRLMTIVRDAEVKVKTKGDVVVISMKNDRDLKRLFSTKPAEATFKIKNPNEPEIVQTISIEYR